MSSLMEDSSIDEFISDDDSIQPSQRSTIASTVTATQSEESKAYITPQSSDPQFSEVYSEDSQPSELTPLFTKISIHPQDSTTTNTSSDVFPKRAESAPPFRTKTVDPKPVAELSFVRQQASAQTIATTESESGPDFLHMDYDAVVEASNDKGDSRTLGKTYERRRLKNKPMYPRPPIFVHRSLSLNPSFLAIALKKPQEIHRSLEVLGVEVPDMQVFFKVLAVLERGLTAQQVVHVPDVDKASTLDCLTLERAKIALLDEWDSLNMTKQKIQTQVFDLNQRVKELESENWELRRDVHGKTVRMQALEKQYADCRVLMKTLRKESSHLRRVHSTDVDFWKKEALEKSRENQAVQTSQSEVKAVREENRKLKLEQDRMHKDYARALKDVEARAQFVADKQKKMEDEYHDIERTHRLEKQRLEREVERLKEREAELLNALKVRQTSEAKTAATVSRMKMALEEALEARSADLRLRDEFQKAKKREVEVTSAFEKLLAVEKKLQESLVQARDLNQYYEIELKRLHNSVREFVRVAKETKEIDFDHLLDALKSPEV